MQSLPASGLPLPQLVVGHRHPDRARRRGRPTPPSCRRLTDEVHGIYFGDGATSSNGFHSGIELRGGVEGPGGLRVHRQRLGDLGGVELPVRLPSPSPTRRAAYGMPGTRRRRQRRARLLRAPCAQAVERARGGAGPSLLGTQDLPHARPFELRRPHQVPRRRARSRAGLRATPIDALRGGTSSSARSWSPTANERTSKQELYEELDRRDPRAGGGSRRCRSRPWSRMCTAEVPRHLRGQYNRFIAGRRAPRRGSTRRRSLPALAARGEPHSAQNRSLVALAGPRKPPRIHRFASVSAPLQEPRFTHPAREQFHHGLLARRRS